MSMNPLDNSEKGLNKIFLKMRTLSRSFSAYNLSTCSLS